MSVLYVELCLITARESEGSSSVEYEAVVYLITLRVT